MCGACVRVLVIQQAGNCVLDVSCMCLWGGGPIFSFVLGPGHGHTDKHLNSLHTNLTYTEYTPLDQLHNVIG